MPPLPVQVATAVKKDVPLFIELVGSTRGTQDVPIRARVEGAAVTTASPSTRAMGSVTTATLSRCMAGK